MATDTTSTWKECKAYIVCDAEGCEENKPPNRCGQCHMVYYCSRECQRKHWKAHKEDCRPIDRMRESVAGIGRESNSLTKLEPDPETIQKVLEESSECGICLEAVPVAGGSETKPIVLAGCHHVFCFGCLKQWNDHQTKSHRSFSEYIEQGGNLYRRQNNNPTCPLCRQSIPNVSEAPMENALKLMEAAGIKKDKFPQECKDLCEQAMAQIDRLISSSSENLSLSEQIQIAVIKGEAALYCQDYESAIDTFQDACDKLEAAVARHKEIDNLMHQAEQIMDDPNREDECNSLLDRVTELNSQQHSKPDQHVGMILKLGQSQRLAKKWEEAKATYQDLARRYMGNDGDGDGDGGPMIMTAPQNRETFTSMSECAYHLGRYDVAIDLGKAAIDMNRFFPWSHKFVALAQKATGDIETATRTAAQAVVYETPWDDKHKLQVQKWYEENFQ